MPKEVIEAVLAIVKAGDEAIVKKEKGRWVVIHNIRRLKYKETDSNRGEGIVDQHSL